MINRLLSYLTGASPQRPLPDADGKHLLGSLLMRVAQADDALHLQELRYIDQLFVRLYGMNPVEAARLRAECERLSQALPATEELGPLLAQSLSDEERGSLMAALYGLAQVDGEMDSREAKMIEAISILLTPAPDKTQS